MRKPSVAIIFLTVFIDLIGFGIIVPLVPLYGKHFQAGEHFLGVIVASFSAMQFVFAPVWGRLSDRIGRRPVLLISTAGAAVSYVVFAIASGMADRTAALWLLLISRVFAGICGGNIGVAQAYIADVTTWEVRSRKMGLIGMAFGLGFILGPILGGLGLKYFGPTGPGWIAASLCTGNFLLALAILGESRLPTSERVKARPHFQQWLHTLRRPCVGLLVVIFFLATFCLSCFESTLAVLVCDNFGLDLVRDERSAATAVFLFAYCGIIGAVVQGGAIGHMVKRLGEVRLVALSLTLSGVSLAVLPFIRGTGQLTIAGLFRAEGLPWLGLLAMLAVLSVGASMTRPPLFGLISMLTPADEQGATIGVAQSAGSLARIFGPLYAFTLFGKMLVLPYLTCAVISIVTAIVVARRLRDCGAKAARDAEAMAGKTA